MEITFYAVCLILIAISVFIRTQEVKRRNESYYLRAYFDIFELPTLAERAIALEQWETRAYKQAYPKIHNTNVLPPTSKNVISIHKSI
jgi:hypothetical protein